MSLGAYSCFGPGQLVAAEPLLRARHGRLLLAGEHTDEFSGFMEGALAQRHESGSISTRLSSEGHS
jgi:monoamine oxidase